MLNSKIGTINVSMLNRFVIIIALTIKYAVNLIFANGISVLNFLPIEIDPGILKFSLHDGYMLLQSTPNLNSEHNMKFIREYLEENLTWSKLKTMIDYTKLKTIVNDGLKSFVKHPEVKENMQMLKGVIDLPELSNFKEILQALLPLVDFKAVL